MTFLTYSFLHRQMKVTNPTIKCQRSELRSQKWCILLTISEYILIHQKDHVTMTTLFTPTIDVDLRVQPLVPRDPRKLEQVTMIAVSGGDNEDLGNNGDDNGCSSPEERGRGGQGLLLILNSFYHISRLAQGSLSSLERPGV